MNRAILHLITFAALLICVASPVVADVLISELCDPRTDYLDDRFIEIYNSGSEAVSLTGWSVIAVGNTNDIFTWNLSGQILPGEALVAGDLSSSASFDVDFPASSWSESCSTWNGKVGDGAKLRNSSGTIVDYAVVPGTTFENSDLVRNPNVFSPSTSYNAAQWTSTAVDTATEASPGEHNAPPPVVGPTIAAIVTNPAAPLPNQSIDITASITDSAANITSVSLNWGYSAALLNNSITMNVQSGSTFITENPIPGQAAGETVYYQIIANNDEPATSTSDVLSFGLPFTLTIQQIQGSGTVSPYVGDTVVADGIVTATFGSSWVIQNGTGSSSGIWVEGIAAPALGTNVTINGQVQELSSNTTIVNAQITESSAGSLPAPTIVTTGTAVTEIYEGVLVQVVNATCNNIDDAGQYWYLQNSGSSLRVDNLGTTYSPTIGTVYTVTGPMSGRTTALGIVPRNAADIVFVEDLTAPSIEDCEAAGPTSIQVTFSEDLSSATAQNTSYYQVSGSSVTNAALVSGHPDQVALTVSYLETGTHILTVDGVTDLHGNALVDVNTSFSYFGGDIPAGYYDGISGLVGEDLRSALHNIIDGHTSKSYTYLWTAIRSTDVKPNGKIWDMYSDIPGGIPPYEYTPGTDQTGGGATEGTGYNREHSWPKSWYGGEIRPMFTDLFVVFPTDVRVNGMRSNHPFGEVDSPTWTSLNGCKLGSCSYPGYTGTAFEPRDDFKGDFARAYFYMTVRYYNEDNSWPGSAMVDGAQLKPWAEAMLLEWHYADPVSDKEIDRNEEIYDIQHNRNPFVDRPDLVVRMFTPEITPVPETVTPVRVALHQNVPNPFNPSTTISFNLPQAGNIDLRVYDMAGRLVRTLYHGPETEGDHSVTWYGQNQKNKAVAAGVYFYRLNSASGSETRRMLLVK